jgi:hypothetical protein
MQKFIAVYRLPVAAMQEWMQLPEETRKTDMVKMEADWSTWMAAHKDKLINGETLGLGKTKHVEKGSIADAPNDLMMSTIFEADSAEAAAEIFKDCPHLIMPGATIDIMPMNKLPNM